DGPGTGPGNTVIEAQPQPLWQLPFLFDRSIAIQWCLGLRFNGRLLSDSAAGAWSSPQMAVWLWISSRE
ncbi:hypothetical protein PSYMO_33190, partial [Pseudomonas amygdali pv. mori str. 301020]